MIHPHDNLTLAKTLALHDDFNHEAAYRAVVGRAYYSVFIFVQNWISERFAEDLKNTPGKTHEKIKNCLFILQRKHHDLQLSTLARNIESFKQTRVTADYYLNRTIDVITAKQAILTGDKLIADIEALKSKYAE